ncbi:ribonuclease HII [Candidatus Microgenomates bacterium]|nr:ribonuclease HII [Candidatus Microgenomates bacterium]
MKTLPDFREEKSLWRRGYQIVIGVDEVGRGAFAGPVVAAAVAFGAEVGQRFFVSCNCGRGKCRAQNHLASPRLVKINDSKVLKANQRRMAAKWIKKNCLAYGVGEVGVRTINKVGIGKATEMAMRKAIASIMYKVSSIKYKKHNTYYKIHNTKSFVLIDAFYIPYIKGIQKAQQKPIKKGDQKSISIAAASIIAKVYRDSLMQKLTERYRLYQWGVNKGYGTKLHQQAIIEYGMTSLHRQQFVQTFLTKTL